MLCSYKLRNDEARVFQDFMPILVNYQLRQAGPQATVPVTQFEVLKFVTPKVVIHPWLGGTILDIAISWAHDRKIRDQGEVGNA
jgi:hypothetical protein